MIDLAKLGVFGQIHSDSSSTSTDILRLDVDGRVRSGGTLNERNIFRRIGRDTEGNNAVRTQFLQALGRTYGIAGATTDSQGRISFSDGFVNALKAKLGDVLQMKDFGVDRNGYVTSGKPLTERRVSQIMDRIWAQNGISVNRPFMDALTNLQLGTQFLPFPQGIEESDAKKLLEYCQKTGDLRKGLVSWMKEILQKTDDASRPEWARGLNAPADLETGFNAVLDGRNAKFFLPALEKAFDYCKSFCSMRTKSGMSVMKPFTDALDGLQRSMGCLSFPKGIGEKDAERLLRHCQRTGGLRQGLVSWMKEILLETPDASRPHWAKEEVLKAPATVDKDGNLEDTSPLARLEASINKVLDGGFAKMSLPALEKAFAVCKDIKSIASHESDNSVRVADTIVAPGTAKTVARLSVDTNRLLDLLRKPLEELGVKLGPESRLIAENGKLGLFVDKKMLSADLKKKIGRFAETIGSEGGLLGMRLTLDVRVVNGKLRLSIPLDKDHYNNGLPIGANSLVKIEEKVKKAVLDKVPKDSTLLKVDKVEKRTEIQKGWFWSEKEVEVDTELLAVKLDPSVLFDKVAAKTAVGLALTGIGIGPGGLVCELSGKAEVGEIKVLKPMTAPTGGTLQADIKFDGLEMPVKNALKNLGVHFKGNGGVKFDALDGGVMLVSLTNIDVRETAGTMVGYGLKNKIFQTFVNGKNLTLAVRPSYDSKDGKIRLMVLDVQSGSPFVNLLFDVAEGTGLVGDAIKKVDKNLSKKNGMAGKIVSVSPASIGLGELTLDIAQLLPPAFRGVIDMTSMTMTEDGLTVSVRKGANAAPLNPLRPDANGDKKGAIGDKNQAVEQIV